MQMDQDQDFKDVLYTVTNGMVDQLQKVQTQLQDMTSLSAGRMPLNTLRCQTPFHSQPE